jgi:hypothetical protein
MSQETKHWAESLEAGDMVIVTIRHETDGSKNINYAKVIVIFNNKRDKNIAASYEDQKIIIPYNDIKPLVSEGEAGTWTEIDKSVKYLDELRLFIKYVSDNEYFFVRSNSAEFWYKNGRKDTPTTEQFLSEYNEWRSIQ